MNGSKEFNEFKDGFFFLTFSIYMYMCIHNVDDCWVLVFIFIDLNALQMNGHHDINCVNFV